MTILEELLVPVSLEELSDIDLTQLTANQWGQRLMIYHNQDAYFPDLSSCKIAIVGVEEDRGFKQWNGFAVLPEADEMIPERNGCQLAPNAVRQALYQLYNWTPQLSEQVVDLGNIKSGKTQKDTYFATSEVVKTLLEMGIIPVIIGGTHDVTSGQFEGHNLLQSLLNVVLFDEKMDLLPQAGELITPNNFLYQMLTKESNLKHFTQLGFQRYLVDPSMVDTLEKLHFECFSLGEIRKNIEEVEPLVRNANMVSFDMSVVRQLDAPGSFPPSIHGFSSEEACRIARYAGMSDHLQSIGLYGYRPDSDYKKITAQLLAQMIWYFVDGFYARKNDFPKINDKSYLRFIVNFKDNDHEIVFLKSKISSRWWMKVPVGNSGNYELVPCSYGDYEQACKEEIPDRWMKAYLRLMTNG